jgi:replication factor C subunit 2/4
MQSNHAMQTMQQMSATATTGPFINKYQPLMFSAFEQLPPMMVDLLKSLIQMHELNLLIVGDSGSGKTSLVNAIVREYYGASNDPENVMILNSLKDQGIQYYRNDMKIFCQTSSLIPGKKKLIILDDIDSINEQSQQVFRNCIDKYKHNVSFIASCTNVQKVIDNLQSRQIIVKINPIDPQCLQNILHKIRMQERIDIHEDAERFVLGVCNGSVRILINYMEKFKIIGLPISLELANQLCTNISFSMFEAYTADCLCASTPVAQCIAHLYVLYDNGYSVMDILDNYFIFIKNTQIINETLQYKTIAIICKYITIFNNIHEDEIELALFTNNIRQLFQMHNACHA